MDEFLLLFIKQYMQNEFKCKTLKKEDNFKALAAENLT